ncbi:MAG: hypothetical protein JSV09_07945 [Thermoplasmata archaeon]|nr:MAG: hypothetical protein JSV09_07945 [Thermoplasmata archaeon]
MPNCPRCDSPVSGMVCPNCGQRFERVVATQIPQQQQPYPYQQYPPPQYVPPPEKSILPIIIFVLVVIMIILAFVGAFFIFRAIEEGTLTDASTTPVLSMYWNEDPEEPGNYMGNVVSISGSETIRTDDVTVTVTHVGQSDSITLDDLAGEDSMQVGTMTLDYEDLPPVMRLGAEDTFTVTGGDSGDTINLVYIPTGSMMHSSTLT